MAYTDPAFPGYTFSKFGEAITARRGESSGMGETNAEAVANCKASCKPKKWVKGLHICSQEQQEVGKNRGI
jgi:hypothetical protein